MKDLDEILVIEGDRVHTARSILAIERINSKIEYEHLAYVYRCIKGDYWPMGVMPDQDNDPVYHLSDLLMVTDYDSLPIQSL